MVNSYGEIGGTLRQRDIQYVAHKDDLGIWRVLDTWHQEMTTKTLTDDLDIPDDSDAVLVIKEGQFLALMKEVEVQGYRPESIRGSFDQIETHDINNEREYELEEELADMTIKRDELLEVIKALRANEQLTSVETEKHSRDMKKLEVIEVGINKGTLDLEMAEIVKSIGETQA